jgi:hypothetical protein
MISIALDDKTYYTLMEVYEFLCEGRAFLAREKLEEILELTPTETK